MSTRIQNISAKDIVRNKQFRKGYKDCILTVKSYDDLFYVCTMYTAISEEESFEYTLGFKYAINVLETALPIQSSKIDVWSAVEILRQHLKEITKKVL